MKKLLKYLLLSMTAILFWNCAENEIPAVSEEVQTAMSFNVETYHTNISTPDSQLFIPRQTSLSCAQRVQTITRRTNGTHRSSFEFAKAGKEVNAGLIYLIQRKSLFTHSSLIKPSERLLYLGQLII